MRNKFISILGSAVLLVLGVQLYAYATNSPYPPYFYRFGRTASTVVEYSGTDESGSTWQAQRLASGELQWGPSGSSGPDTDLYRSAAGVLKTDTNLVIGNLLRLGPPVSGSNPLYYPALFSGASGPSSGSWSVGDIELNNNPIPFGPSGGEQAFTLGWANGASGSPGTWNPINISTVVAITENVSWSSTVIAHGTTEISQWAFTGAAPGNRASVGWTTDPNVGILERDSVVAGPSFQVVLFNFSGADQTVPSQTITLEVRQ